METIKSCSRFRRRHADMLKSSLLAIVVTLACVNSQGKENSLYLLLNIFHLQTTCVHYFSTWIIMWLREWWTHILILYWVTGWGRTKNVWGWIVWGLIWQKSQRMDIVTNPTIKGWWFWQSSLKLIKFSQNTADSAASSA